MSDHNSKPVNGKMIEDPKIISKKVSAVLKKIDLTGVKKHGKRGLFEQLNDSNSILADKLNALRTTSNCLKDKKQADIITQLVKEMEDIDEQLKVEKSYLKDLKTQTHQLTLKRPQANAGIKSELHCDKKKLEKSKENLLDRLHSENSQLSNLITKNSELKEKIKVLMDERKRFNKNYYDLLDRLEKGKTVMKDLTAAVQNANAMRQHITESLKKINTKEQKQMALQDQEAFELTMRYDLELTQKSFISTKTMSRTKHSDAAKKLHRKTMSFDNEVLKNLRTVLDGLQHTYGLKNSMPLNSEKIYNVGELVKLVTTDNSEFKSLFTYVTNLVQELEVVKDRVCSQMKEFEEKSEEHLTKEMLISEKIKDLEDFKRYFVDLKTNIEDEVLSYGRDLEKLYKGIELLLHLSKTDTSPLLALLGENTKVTYFNSNLFLEALETKVVNLLALLPSYSLSGLITLKCNPMNDMTDRRGQDKTEEGIGDKIILTLPCDACFPPPIKRSSDV